MTRVLTFDKITYTARKLVKVPFKAKRKPLQKTFWKIHQPCDRHSDGRLKTRADIYLELKAEAEAWLNAKEA